MRIKEKWDRSAWVNLGGMLVLLLVILILHRFTTVPRPLAVFRGWVPLAGRTIVIDPGHGGIDGGTNHRDGTLEKDINLQVSLALKRVLEKIGANVIMTRTTDTALDHLNNKDEYRHKRDLIARADIINKTSPDVFLCIHVNSERRSSKIAGPMTFYFHSNVDSRNIADLVQRRLEEVYDEAGQNIKPRTPIANSNLFILKNTQVPGVLIELGFITNQKDRALLTSSEFQQELAEAVVKGLKDYF